jgi:DNA modification methylase
VVEIRTMKYPRYPQDDRLISSPEIPKDKVLIWKKDLNREKLRYYGADSIGHPAKMHVKLAQWIIKNFTEFGDTILDPMAGIGTTLLEAAVLGRNAVGIEYEKRFVMVCMENVGLFTRYPTLNRKGNIQLILGDARDMSELLSGRVEGIVMSPPYMTQAFQDQEFIFKSTKTNPSPRRIAEQNYGEGVDVVITSPPYGEIRMDGGGCGDRGNHIKPYSGEDGGTWRTQRDQDNLGNLTHGDIDAVVMSPPFSTSPRTGNKDPEKFKKQAEAKHKRDFSKSQNAMLPMDYSDDPKNIGNLNSKSYLSEMKKVYTQCFQVLRPGGKAILVTKNFTRKQKVVRLDYDTILLMESCGFKLIDRYFRKITNPSFWIRNYWHKFPDVERVDHEDILVFEKIN